MKPLPFGYVAPDDLGEATAALATYGDEAKVLAGGQSLGPLLNLRLARPTVLIDLREVAQVHGEPDADGDLVRMGAMTRQRAAECSSVVREECPLLAEALPFVAHRTIRNQGTIGGSLAHADPAAEIPAVAVALEAQVVASSAGGQRVLTAARLIEGFFTTSLAPDELISEIWFPRPGPDTGWAWEEFAPRRGDFAIVGVAATVTADRDGRVAAASVVCSGVADRPWRADAAETAVVGRPADEQAFAAAGDAAAESSSPAGDLVASVDYRRHLTSLLVRRALTRAASRSGGVANR